MGAPERVPRGGRQHACTRGDRRRSERWSHRGWQVLGIGRRAITARRPIQREIQPPWTPTVSTAKSLTLAEIASVLAGSIGQRVAAVWRRIDA